MAATAMIAIAVVVMQDSDAGSEGQIGVAWTAVLGVLMRRTKQRPMDKTAQEIYPWNSCHVQGVDLARCLDVIGYIGDEGMRE